MPKHHHKIYLNQWCNITSYFSITIFHNGLFPIKKVRQCGLFQYIWLNARIKT